MLIFHILLCLVAMVNFKFARTASVPPNNKAPSDEFFVELEDFNPLSELETLMEDIVDTTSGVFISTTTKSKTNNTVRVFYGIPYAKPPIGELRFKPPQEAIRKPGLTVADKKGNACYQYGPEKTMKLLRKLGYSVPPPYSEDCLTLNIWVPRDIDRRHLLPVMVFLHGGGFYLGSSTDYYSDGATLVSEENVIVVSLNFRLGILGFLSLGLREEAPGNAGLMDQQMALRWVNRNIAKFGGDPKKVTLFGVSSGSSCVGFHIMSPGSSDFFQRAIMMSGVPSSASSFNDLETVIRKSVEVARNLNYKGTDDPYEVLAFLRSKSAEEVSQAADVCGDEKYTIGPTYDGTFIKDDPEDMKYIARNNIAVMIGTTSDEGTFEFISKYPYLFSRYEDSELEWADFEHILKKLEPSLTHEMVSVITRYYVDHSKPVDDPIMIRDAAIKAIGDFLVFCDTQDFADTLAEMQITVYRYIFDGRANMTQAHVPKWSGALHGCDGLLLFGDFLDSDQMTSEYLQFVREVMRKFANFARTGSPNLSAEESRIESIPIPWPLYHAKERYSTIIRSNGDTEIQHPRSDNCAAWKYLIKSMKYDKNPDEKEQGGQTCSGNNID